MASPPDGNALERRGTVSADRVKIEGRETMTRAAFLIAGLAAAIPAAAFASEYPVTPEEEKYCDVDYRQYCN
jgi:hypothetical protein